MMGNSAAEPSILRMATPEDAGEIRAVYAPYVQDSVITFEYEVPSLAEFRGRIEATLQKYPYLVALVKDRIVGYAYAGAFRTRAAYSWSAESTVYLAPAWQGKGIGRQLYHALETLLARQHITNINACITYPNPASIAFHERMGYRQIAHFSKCGYKKEAWWDMIWMEKMIAGHEIPPAAVIPITEVETPLWA